MNQIASQNAPSPKVVIPHYAFGGLTWLAVTLLIVFNPEAFTQHFFNPELLAITHLLVLGWITMIIFGALYQLLPVIMEVKLYSEPFAIASFIMLGMGTILLAFAFWIFSFGAIMFVGATFIVLAVVLFVANVLFTARSSTKKAIERTFIVTSVIWLLFTVLAGLTLAINQVHPFLKTSQIELLKLHAHAGIVGWFIQLIIGVSSKLLPMFMVSHQVNTKKLTVAYYAINIGLIVGLVSLFLQLKSGIVISAIIIVPGIFSYLSFIYEAYTKRVKKQLDIGMKQTAFSFLILVIPFFLIFSLLFNFKFLNNLTLPLSVAYGSAIVIGFITSLVMGQTYKTLPFIVWLKVYRGRIGKVVLPLPKDLYSEKIAIAQLWLFAIGFVLLLIGISASVITIVLLGAIVLLLSASLYNFNLFKIIFHKPKNK
jgi:cbb3-type cytochrome oxidase subunit 1